MNRSDNFDRSGTLNGSVPSDGGSVWQLNYGNLTLSDGKVYNSADSNKHAVLDSGEVNGVVSALFSTPSSDPAKRKGLLARWTNASNCYLFVVDSTKSELLKVVSNSYTLLDSDSFNSQTSPMTLSVFVDGSHIDCLINGNIILSADDTSHLSATKFGFWLDRDDVVRVDDFSFTIPQSSAVAYSNIESAQTYSGQSLAGGSGLYSRGRIVNR